MGVATPWPPQSQPRPYTETEAVNFTGSVSSIIAVPSKHHPIISNGFTIRQGVTNGGRSILTLFLLSLSSYPYYLYLPLPLSLFPFPSSPLPLPLSPLSHLHSLLSPSRIYPPPPPPPMILLVAGSTPMSLQMEHLLPRQTAQLSSMLLVWQSMGPVLS